MLRCWLCGCTLVRRRDLTFMCNCPDGKPTQAVDPTGATHAV